MIGIVTTVDVFGVTAQQVFDIMIGCTDARYQEWWPGTHFRFHTEKHFPGYYGNILYFDELIGNRRVKSRAVIRDVEKNSKILWQLKSVISLPFWIELSLNEKGSSLEISHIMRAGFNGPGKSFDCIFRLILDKKFESDLNDHVNKEFSLLAKQLGIA